MLKNAMLHNIEHQKHPQEFVSKYPAYYYLNVRSITCSGNKKSMVCHNLYHLTHYLLLILVVALKWLSVETLELLGSWSNIECRMVQSWVLSFTCYIQPTFQSFSPNTSHLVTSMLMMCRRSSMVHLLISSLLLAALMLWMSSNRLSLNPNKTQFIWFGTPHNFCSLPSPFSQRDFPLLSFIPVFETFT